MLEANNIEGLIIQGKLKIKQLEMILDNLTNVAKLENKPKKRSIIKKTQWTDKEEKILIDMWPTNKVSNIAKELRRTEGAIHAKSYILRSNGIKLVPKKIFRPKVKEYVI